jgi:hypothetical protein
MLTCASLLNAFAICTLSLSACRCSCSDHVVWTVCVFCYACSCLSLMSLWPRLRRRRRQGKPARAMEKLQWRTLRRGKCPWTFAEVVHAAEVLLQEMPEAAVQIIRRGTFKGTLCKLDNVLVRPSMQEIDMHYECLRPWCLLLPCSVPSAYFIADVYLQLDVLFEGKLLAGDKRQVALDDALRCRKLISGLRTLWREHSSTSRYENIVKLKALLQPGSNSSLGKSCLALLVHVLCFRCLFVFVSLFV